MRNLVAVNNNALSEPSESWSDANNRGKESAGILVEKMRSICNPTLLGIATQQPGFIEESDGYKIGFFTGIANSVIY